MPLQPGTRFLDMIRAMVMDERNLFKTKPETRSGRYQCPKCRRTNDYNIRWMRHTKKSQMPGGADAASRAKFDKLRDYLLRLDDEVTCKTCRRRFEVPSQHSLMFVDQLAGLPNDEELEREIAAAAGDEPADDTPAAAPDPPTRKPSGWK